MDFKRVKLKYCRYGLVFDGNYFYVYYRVFKILEGLEFLIEIDIEIDIFL